MSGGKAYLVVDSVVVAPPDIETLDERAASQAVLVEVDAVETSMSLVTTPHLHRVPPACPGHTVTHSHTQSGR